MGSSLKSCSGDKVSWLDGSIVLLRSWVRFPMEANFSLGLIILGSSAPRSFFEKEAKLFCLNVNSLK